MERAQTQETKENAIMESGRDSPDEFPPSLAWVERGASLIRRMNSERIAEDPRLRRLVLQMPLPAAPQSEAGLAVIPEVGQAQGELDGSGDDTEEKMAPPAPPSLDPQESFEEIEAARDENEIKQESENVASNAYRVLLWTYRLQASLQSALQYALFAKTSEDGYFIPIAPRVFCIAPAYVNTFNRLFASYSSPRTWTAAVKLLEQLDHQLSTKFADGACVFDCGLFDGVKRLHHKPLVYDEFCDGRVASIPFCRGAIPSMHSSFVISSTVAAWLDLKPLNVAVLLAPNNEQMSVFATCCTLYCTDAMSFPENFAYEFLDVYQQHIRGSETWPAKIQRTFSAVDARNVVYTGGLPRPQARFVTDFCKLLEIRDKALINCADSPSMDERKHKLTGIAVTPAPQDIYVRQIELLSESDAVPDTPHQGDCRPYFVIQNEKGVLFSSMINGVRNVDLLAGPHLFRVCKQLRDCRDLVLKMYHLPFGRQGELILECRLHTSILLDRSQGSLLESPDASGSKELILSVDKGDFDCISSCFTVPKQFAIKIVYSRDSSAFASESAPDTGAENTAEARPAHNAHWPSYGLGNALMTGSRSVPVPTSNHRGQHSAPKPVRYEGPTVVSFLIDAPNVRTAFGDCRLDKIDVLRKVHRNRLDIYLLFYADFGAGNTKVLPYCHLFRYLLPDPVRERIITMGADEESLSAAAPSWFDIGHGMSFDEEYARWLQHQYDTDFENRGSNANEWMAGVPAAELQPSEEYRAVSIETTIVQDPSPPNSLGRFGQRNRRGASPALLQQLPTYIFRSPKEQGASINPDCLVCRCCFEIGEEIKSLPCFHSYHSDCIDSWLSVNKVCPVCQFSVDNAN